MNTQTQIETGSGQLSDSDIQQKVQELQALFADAPEMGKTALANVLRNMKSEESSQVQPSTPTESAGRIGYRQGNVSELTAIAPLAKGGAKRMRGVFKLLHGNFEGAGEVGTVHDMRFVFLDNDTKMLFATTYDGDWDDYITDFVTKIPDYMDVLFSAFEGWPGIHSPTVKDYIVKYQITADAWYVANPNLTVVQTRRLERIDQALNEFLDKIAE
jgi:hypothetical protein